MAFEDIMSILSKLTTRNIIANATVAIFLYGIYFGINNIEKLSKALEESSLLAAFTGSFLTIVPIVYFFYFRRSGKSEDSTS